MARRATRLRAWQLIMLPSNTLSFMTFRIRMNQSENRTPAESLGREPQGLKKGKARKPAKQAAAFGTHASGALALIPLDKARRRRA